MGWVKVPNRKRRKAISLDEQESMLIGAICQFMMVSKDVQDVITASMGEGFEFSKEIKSLICIFNDIEKLINEADELISSGE